MFKVNITDNITTSRAGSHQIGEKKLSNILKNVGFTVHLFMLPDRMSDFLA